MQQFKQQSYARQALETIALEMGKPTSLVEPYIQILEENWYDTQDAITQMKQENFDEFKIPKRIAQLLMEYVRRPKESKLNWQLELARIVSEIADQDQLLTTFETLYKIITNVITNPLSCQYQKINVTSKTLQNHILRFNSALNYLKNLDWKVEGGFLQVTYKIDSYELWFEAAQQLLNMVQKDQGFNPQKAQIFSSSGGAVTSQLAKQEGYDIYSFSEKLRQLEQRRYEIMSQKIDNREIKIFIGQNQQSGVQMQQQIQDKDDFEEVQPEKDQILMNFLKQVAQSLEEQNFASKRQKEYQELLKKPVFSKTEIRVQFPNSVMLQANFSPLETLENLFILIKSMLANPEQQFYLYTTPPVVRMGVKHMNQTFDDLCSVPNGLFYFGVEQQTSQYYFSQQWLATAIYL